MSRLQVGGLALYIPEGVSCTLVAHHGMDYIGDDFAKKWDVWEIELNDLVLTNDTKILRSRGYCSSHLLMPLGDKQTQDELMKELEEG